MLPPLCCVVVARQKSGTVLTFVVMPCLNEVDFVASAIASLGFSENGAPSPDTHLIAVDNGSTDGTLSLLNQIRSATGPSLHVVTEPIRGFVPPRRRGVLEAQLLARNSGVPENEVLILQADADTIYRRGYAATMQHAVANTAGVVLEGSTKPPLDFALAHPFYLAAQRIVDDETDPLVAEDEDEVVLDDKVCGYRLSDYLNWGGLFEEFTAMGEAIHAETTRMFVRARLRHGARKLRVNPAGAMPSRRKVIENPWLQFATVGFPREASWIAARAASREAGGDVDMFSLGVIEGRNLEATHLRRAHQLALFRYLPALVANGEPTKSRVEQPSDIANVLAALPLFSGEDMAECPGRTLLAVLNLIEARPELFESKWSGNKGCV